VGRYVLDGYSEVHPVRGAVKRVRRGEDRLRSGLTCVKDWSCPTL
jgi:hypothetical protein